LGVASTVRADVDADFLVDRSVKTVESNGGDVQTLTASVVVDSAAVDPADMATLTTLVEAATGLSVENGNLSVAALAFDTTAEQQLTAANEAATEAAGVADAAAAQQATMRTGIIAGFAAIAGLLALLSFRRARKSTTTDGAADKLEALLSGETQALERTAPTADMTALNPGEQLALVSSEHPDDVAELIGSWMTERTAVTQ
ncbi:MAG: flagellar M-ring protein FliF C-terminal domain-containing protein, partial [Ilumatobacteraceae bacterium]